MGITRQHNFGHRNKAYNCSNYSYYAIVIGERLYDFCCFFVFFSLNSEWIVWLHFAVRKRRCCLIKLLTSDSFQVHCLAKVC